MLSIYLSGLVKRLIGCMTAYDLRDREIIGFQCPVDRASNIRANHLQRYGWLPSVSLKKQEQCPIDDFSSGSHAQLHLGYLSTLAS